MEKKAVKKRYDNLDLLKAFGIMAVVSLHVPLWNADFMGGGTRQQLCQYAVRLISEGVPIFLTINGFLLLRKNQFDLNAHLKKMGRILLLLILWGVILGVTGFELGHPKEPITFEMVYYYLVNTRVSFEYTGVLWFLQKLLAVYLIFPGLWYLYREHFSVFRYVFYVITAFVPGITTLNLLRDLTEALIGQPLPFFTATIDYINELNPVGNGWYVFYFCLGGMIYHEMDRLMEHHCRWIVAAVLSWPMAFGFGYWISILTGVTYNESFNYGSPFMVVTITGALVGTMSYKNVGRPLQRAMASVGKNTFGIYLSHFIFIFILNSVWERKNFTERLGAYFIVFVCGYLFSVIITRIPYVRKLVEI